MQRKRQCPTFCGDGSAGSDGKRGGAPDPGTCGVEAPLPMLQWHNPTAAFGQSQPRQDGEHGRTPVVHGARLPCQLFTMCGRPLGSNGRAAGFDGGAAATVASRLRSSALCRLAPLPASLRMLDGLLAVRGIVVGHGRAATRIKQRRCALRVGRAWANRTRRSLPAAGDMRRLDAGILTISGVKHWPRRAAAEE